MIISSIRTTDSQNAAKNCSTSLIAKEMILFLFSKPKELWDTILHHKIWYTSKRQRSSSADIDMGRKGLLFSASKNVLGLVILRVNLVIPQNTRIELPNSTPSNIHYSFKNKNKYRKDYCTLMFIATLFTILRI